MHLPSTLAQLLNYSVSGQCRRRFGLDAYTECFTAALLFSRKKKQQKLHEAQFRQIHGNEDDEVYQEQCHLICSSLC